MEIDGSNLLMKNEERVEKVGNITWHRVDTRWEIHSDGIFRSVYINVEMTNVEQD